MSETNWKSKTMFTGDCLDVMRGMNSECVDLIYLDPPFNSNNDYAAPIGSPAEGAEFKDTWSLDDVKAEWVNLIESKHPALYRVLLAAMTDSNKAYLSYMAIRLLEMKRILKPSASIWLHCDPTMGHNLKLVMDAIFGHRSLRNEIVWGYTGPGSPGMRQFARKHDTLFWFSVGPTWTFNRDDVRIPHKDGGPHAGGFPGGVREPDSDYYQERGKIPESWWVQERGNGLAIAARQPKQYRGYPTQKPEALLRRILAACSNQGDVVLDPFCGCATTCVVAEELGREWTGIDISYKAAELVVDRIRDKQLPLFEDITHRRDIPQRTDLGAIPPYNARQNRRELYGEQGGYCNGCTTHFEMRNLTIDHIVPRSRGGSDHISNLQLLCGNCNSIKGDRGMEYLMAKLEMRRRDIVKV